jgi:glycosyltransferase involved in cell wall biosynthesis
MAGVPILYTEHGTFGVGRKPTPGDRLKKPMKGWFLRCHADYVSFNSRYTRDAANSLYGISRVPQGVVYNGTSLTDGHLVTVAADEATVRRCKGRTVVSTFSRFTKRKKIDRLLEAFADVDVDSQPVLLLVGDGPELESLKTLSARLGIGDRVVFTGYRANVSAYISLMDICVFPAAKEPFGLAAIEALARGKPAIVFHDGGGLTEIVADLEKEDVTASLGELSKRISYYCRNPVQRERAAASRREYVERFSIEKMAENFDRIYSDLLDPRAGGKDD